jgi:hypothetical protein
MAREGRRGVRALRGFLALSVLALLAAPAADAAGSEPGAAAALARADAAWERRAEGGAPDGVADARAADAAIDAYDLAVAEAPTALEPRWKLARALCFGARFVPDPEDRVGRLLDRATSEGEAAMDLLSERIAKRTGGDPLSPEALREGLAPDEVGDAAATLFWSAVAWGAWSQHRSTADALRMGVAGRLYRRAVAVAALAPDFDGGGAHRLLARLHAQVPRVPFLSGWVDPSRAVPEAELAVAIDPDDPANRYLLALTLLDVAPQRHADAVRLLEDVVDMPPRSGQLVEDRAMRHAARERLLRERGLAARLAQETTAGGG